MLKICLYLSKLKPIISFIFFNCVRGFRHNSVGKESACNAGDLGLIPGSGRSAGERLPTPVFLGFPCGLAGKESTCSV